MPQVDTRRRWACLMAFLLAWLGSVPLLSAETTPSCCASAPMTVSVTHHAPRGPVLRATTTVQVVDFTFHADSITIAVGDTVTWSNNSGITHTSTSDTGVWDSGDMATGSSFSFTFTSAGTFPYHCQIHVAQYGMRGTVTVVAPPTITSPTSASASEGDAFSYQTVAAGATSFSATGLPAGLTISAATGAITGTPTASGSFPVSLTATSVGGPGTATLTIAVAAPAAGSPLITSAATASGTAAAAFSYGIVATNTPTSYSATGLPSGLTVNATTGLISGTPAAAGASDVVIGAANASGSSSTTITLNISAATGTSGSGTTGATGVVTSSGGSSSGGCGLGGGAMAARALATWYLRRRSSSLS